MLCGQVISADSIKYLYFYRLESIWKLNKKCYVVVKNLTDMKCSIFNKKKNEMYLLTSFIFAVRILIEYVQSF